MALAGFQGWLGGELVYSDGVTITEHLPFADLPQAASAGSARAGAAAGWLCRRGTIAC